VFFIGLCVPYADVPQLGGIQVITDGDKPKGNRLQPRSARIFIAMRGRTAPDYLDCDEE
jgi:hypothetical protein